MYMLAFVLKNVDMLLVLNCGGKSSYALRLKQGLKLWPELVLLNPCDCMLVCVSMFDVTLL